MASLIGQIVQEMIEEDVYATATFHCDRSKAQRRLDDVSRLGEINRDRPSESD